MTVTLCVLLTPVGGKEADLVAYEDLVLPMLERHRGHMLHRVRRADGGNDPYEVHLIDFPDDAAVAATSVARPPAASTSRTRSAAASRSSSARCSS